MNCGVTDGRFGLQEASGRHAGPGQDALVGQLQTDRTSIPAKRIRPSIESIAEYMLQNLNHPVRISTLCELAELSPSAFFARFKRVTGQSPIAYLIRARMGLAVRLLEQPNLGIKQIAALVGYPDEFHFSRRFKSTIGLSPRHYRATATQKRHEVSRAREMISL